MKLTKRMICLLLAMMLTFALCACGDKEKEEAEKVDDAIASVSDALDDLDDLGGNLEGEQQFNDATLAW